MRCPKCKGWAEDYTFLDCPGDYTLDCFDGYKCINCGLIFDNRILLNRYNSTHGGVSNGNRTNQISR